MKFTKVYDEEFAMKKRGFKFVFVNEEPLGFGHDPRLQGNILDREVDSMYDGDCPVCSGEDGQLYGVEYCYIHGALVPGVWQRVTQVSAEALRLIKED